MNAQSFWELLFDTFFWADQKLLDLSKNYEIKISALLARKYKNYFNCSWLYYFETIEKLKLNKTFLKTAML